MSNEVLIKCLISAVESSLENRCGKTDEECEEDVERIVYFKNQILEKMNGIDNTISKINRLEVIDSNGRNYVNNNCSVEASVQDGCKTLKLFIK